MKWNSAAARGLVLLVAFPVVCAAGDGKPNVPGSLSGFPESAPFGQSVGSGARALALGGAFIAVADDASASSWNPAGLCGLEKPEISAVFRIRSRFVTNFAPYTFHYATPGSASALAENYTERDTGGTLSKAGSGFDFASITYPVRVGSVRLVPQLHYQRAIDLGLSPTLNYGFNFEDTLPQIPETFSQQTMATLAGSASGGVDLYAASLGVRFTEKLYLGATLNLWRNGSTNSRTTVETSTGNDSLSGATSLTTTRTRTSTDTFQGTNFNLGFLFKPGNQLRIGAVYKSAFDMAYTLSVTDAGGVPFSTSNRPGSNEVDTGTIRWPRTIGFGIAILPVDVLILSADYTQTNWSAATYEVRQTGSTAQGQPFDSHRSLTFPGLFDPSQPVQNPGNVPQGDSRQIRFGAEYVLKSPPFLGLVALPLRAGAFTDQQIDKDTPGLGKINHTGVTGGLGLVWARLTLDFAWVHESGDFRSGDVNPTTVSNADPPFTISRVADAKDKFSSNRFFVSTTVRF